MDLDAKAVVLRLHTDGSELLDHSLGVGQSLGKLRAERVAGPDLQGVEACLATFPERARDEAEVGGAVISGLQHGSQGAVSFFGERQRVEHGRVADPQPHLAERDSDEVLGRGRVQVGKQAGEAVELLLLAARTSCLGDLVQAGMGFDHGR